MLGETVLFPQSIVTIAGKEAKVRLINAGRIQTTIKSYPEFVEPLHLFVDGDDLILTILGRLYHPEINSFMVFGVLGAEDVKVPVRTFTDREFFLVFCLQANFHLGTSHDGNVNPWFACLFDDTLVNGGTLPYTPLERVYHEKGIPVSWIIDPKVAEGMASKIIQWNRQFGDTYSVIPSSYGDESKVNYNIDRGITDAKKLLKASFDGVVAAFRGQGFSRYPNVAGVDAWLGSVGSNFVRAAVELGFKGLWGLAWDEDNAETSMFHVGAPWDAYKPSKYQFRIPARKNERFELFLFQSSTRDLVNSLHLSPRGSSLFTTSPSGLKKSMILEQKKPNYLMEVFFNYFKNQRYNDYFVFIVSQDDHDACNEDYNRYLNDFLVVLMEDKPPSIVFATLDEVAQWLSIKYPDNAVPSQVLELDDPLVPKTREAFRRVHSEIIAQIHDPLDDEDLAKIIVEHFPSSRLPTHVAFFDRDFLFLGYKPYHLPVQVYDYRNQENWSQPEDGKYPPALLPRINLVDEVSTDMSYQITIVSDKFYTKLPWIAWNPLFKIKLVASREKVIPTDNAVIFFINVQAGMNKFDFKDLIT